MGAYKNAPRSRIPWGHIKMPLGQEYHGGI